MTRLTPAQWRMASRVTTILFAEGGLTEASLAERLGVTITELRRVTGMLIGRGLVERCDAYLVLAKRTNQAAGGAA